MSIRVLGSVLDSTFGLMVVFTDDSDQIEPVLLRAIIDWRQEAKIFERRVFFTGKPENTEGPAVAVPFVCVVKPYGVPVYHTLVGRRALLCYRYYKAVKCSNGMELLGDLLVEKPTQEAAAQELLKLCPTV